MPPIPHKIFSPPPPPLLETAIQLIPSMRMLAMSSAVVTGASVSPRIPESFLLRAARENVRLVPQLWHRVALIPTREPHAGQSLGRGCWLPPAKSPRTAFFHLSIRHCH